MKRTLVIVPTYNERENIETVLGIVFGLEIPGLDVLIVDDNSPDQTAAVVKEMMATNDRLFLLERSGKLGLGTAYVAGFEYALEKGYDYIFEMDADLSHDPRVIPNFLKLIEEADLVVGSRYITGGGVVNWPRRRLALSVFASKYTRAITGMPISDCTGGFKCFRREVLEAIPFDGVRSNGYAFQIEMNFKTWKRNFRIRELPITFTDRTVGKSKMSNRIVFEAIFMVWKIKIMSLFGKY